MILDEVVAWYQKKIGTYDKQQWEKSVEQKILDGFNTVTLNKTAKLKTDLIDVDLVRGSTFPKAKPKQTLFTVIRLAILRYVFLPAYAQWWVKQTSPNIFGLLLILYITQMVNLALYDFNIHSCEHNSQKYPRNGTKYLPEEYIEPRSVQQLNCIASMSDLLMPISLSLLLSLIHSQIVATNIVSGNKVKRKSLTKICHNQVQSEKPKVRRRKKYRFRSHEEPQEKCSRVSAQINPGAGCHCDNCPCVPSTYEIPEYASHDRGTECFKEKDFNENVGINTSARITNKKRSPRLRWDNISASNLSDKEVIEQFVDELIQNIDSSHVSAGSKSSTAELDNHHCSPNLSNINAEQYLNESCHYPKLRKARIVSASSEDTDEEDDFDDNPRGLNSNMAYNEFTTSATEWLGVTTNSEDCSGIDLDDSSNFKQYQRSDEDGYDLDFMPTRILNAINSSDKISCTLWDNHELKKAQMSVLEISSCIIDRVEAMADNYDNDYIYIGVCFSILLTLIPPIFRLCQITVNASATNQISLYELPTLLWKTASFSFWTMFKYAFGTSQWEQMYLLISFMQRLFLTTILFIIFAAAEKTFKQRWLLLIQIISIICGQIYTLIYHRFLYAKLFSHITSLRRAQKSNLPHFRLNKVRNIKAWLSVRSYLKKRGPQRSVDVIVSAAFLVTLTLLAFLSVEWLQDSTNLQSQINLEALMWCTTIGVFLLRYMTLGNKIQQKYRSISVLITEQINLYLQIERKPHKKDELMVANSVLKLAADLLKELESPFKISGLSANPYLFTTIKVVILSALSGILSEMLGFKLKLHKIKIK